MHEILERFKKVKLLILDIDGILTDGRLWYLPNGEEVKVFYVQDGHGIKCLLKHGIPVAIISSRANPSALTRLQELNIEHFYLGQKNKLDAYIQLREKLKISDEAIAYMGDDLPDLPVMQKVGLSITVPNAVPQIKAMAHFQTELSGGYGAVRQVCDLILKAQS